MGFVVKIFKYKESTAKTFLILYFLLAILGIYLVCYQFELIGSFIHIFWIFPFLYTLYCSLMTNGLKKTAIFIFIIFLTTLLFECFAISTGVFGKYEYTTSFLGYKLFNSVPFNIPICWIIMIYPSMLIAERLLITKTNTIRHKLQVSCLTGLIITSWDIAMDPMMVSKGAWKWTHGGAFFGIPLQNYLGWWLISFIAIMIFQLTVSSDNNLKPDKITVYAAFSYIIITISTIITDYLLDFKGVSLAGFFAVMPWIIIYILRL